MNVLDDEGLTLLLKHINRGSLEYVVAVLVLGANPDLSSKGGQLPIQLAIEVPSFS